MNPVPVPEVEGRQLDDACGELQKANYVGGVTQRQRGRLRHAIVVRVAPQPGSYATLGEILKLVVKGRLALDRLPKGCVSRLHGTY